MHPRLVPKSWATLQISRHYIGAHGLIPNTSLQNKPLIIYHACFPATLTASAVRAYLCSIGVVVPQWTYTMYTDTHFHSSTLEVLCIVSGRALCCFGGERNPDRIETVLEKGDVVLVPAGVGHCLVEDMDGGFQMIGSYPPGKDWDMCYGREDEHSKIEGIIDLEPLTRDPIYGDHGPALD